MNLNKNFDIQNARDMAGWAYNEMKWLSSDEARKAGQKRNELLQSIHTRVQKHFHDNKISTGPLSPGCMSCGGGTWSCLFIGSLCTADCFYCPQDRRNKTDQPPTESGLVFQNPDDYVDYLERFHFKGVGFSGGEPLLKFKAIMSFIEKIRERLGKRIYIWVYTNGDLVDEKKLKLLKEAGLNELRFDISARSYDLKKVKLAAGILDRVTVEIPAIPEDYEVARKSLAKMRAAGVAHLNLHQLHASRYCYKRFIDRGYTFLHQPEIAVLESEITALKLVDYALSHNIALSINYCSLIYKHRLQKQGYRYRFAPLVKDEYEETTEAGFLRRLSVCDKPANLKNLAGLFQKKGSRDGLFYWDKKHGEIIFHPSLLKYMNATQCGLNIKYWVPQLSASPDPDLEKRKTIPLNPQRNVYVGKRFVYQANFAGPVSVKSFQKLFLEKRDSRGVLKYFFGAYPLETRDDVAAMMNVKDLLDYLRIFEFTGRGLAEIY